MNWENAIINQPEKSGHYIMAIAEVSSGIIQDNIEVGAGYYQQDVGWDLWGEELLDGELVVAWSEMPKVLPLKDFMWNMRKDARIMSMVPNGWNNALYNPPTENGDYLVVIGYIENGVLRDISKTLVTDYNKMTDSWGLDREELEDDELVLAWQEIPEIPNDFSKNFYKRSMADL